MCHWVGKEYKAPEYYNPVDGDEVPVPHFGIVLEADKFHDLARRVEAAGISFVVPVKTFSLIEIADIAGNIRCPQM